VTVFETIRRRIGDCSPAERRVARTLLSGSATVGLDSAGRLAATAGVSGATVTRFVDRLGYASYVDFQTALREEVDARLISPSDLYRRYQEQPFRETALTASHTVLSESVVSTLRDLEVNDFATAVSLVSGATKVFATGGRFSHVLAMRLVHMLQEVRPHTRLVGSNDRLAAVIDAGRRDVALVFDHRRYESETAKFARALDAAGASVILFTDPWLSPIAQIADVVFSIPVESPSPFESLTASLAVVEALVAGVVDALGERGRARFERFGSITDDLVDLWEGDGATRAEGA
jgi:DNA-binding MurR/RpiR family transcriptional regulator